MLRSLDWIVYLLAIGNWELLCAFSGAIPNTIVETWSGNLPPGQGLYSVTHSLVCFV
jgi:hypothetical protein